MKILITGAAGQVGRALIDRAPQTTTIFAGDYAELDIADASSVSRCLESFRPDVIINAAAYTAVDKAEDNEAAAIRGNIDGPRNLALLCKKYNVRLIHLSTDFVFDGRCSSPYKPDDVPAPLSVYGRTKLAGERVVLEVLGGCGLVVRTSWVYAARGNNFMRTMLRLMTEHGAVRVIADQVGGPTAAHSLAEMLWRSISNPEMAGIFHWSDAGVASWYDFAVAIAEEAHARGLLPKLPQVTPIATHEYPTPAARPPYSVLDKSDSYAALQLTPVHWRQNLRKVMAEL